MTELRRRTVLGHVAGLAAALAGCAGDGPATDVDATSTTGRTTDATATDPTTVPETTGPDAGARTDAPVGSTRTATPEPTAGPQSTVASTTTRPATTAGDLPTWKTATLEDVLTGETFTLADFAGQPVLLETFAVWCPICTTQQENIQAFLADRPEVVVVSLNVDANESAATVRAHAEDKGFDWRYAVSPSAMTRSLIDAFGPVVTSPPSAPVIRICPDGRARSVEGRGAKSPSTLADALGRC